MEGKIKTKDEIRFHKKNNLITSRLGGEKKLLQVARQVLKNEEYKSIFIFSDGITDCLSEEAIKNTIDSSKSQDVVQNLMFKALTTVSSNESLDEEDYYREIYGGKDNQAVATLTRKRRN